MCWVGDKFLGRIFECVSDRCLSGISDLGPFWCYWLSSGRFQRSEDVSASFPHPHIGQVWSFYFVQDQVCFICIFSTRSLQKKKKKVAFLCFLATGLSFLNHFPQGPHFSRVSTFSSLPCTKTTFPKPIWHSWMLLKLWVGAEQGIKSTQSPAASRSELICICASSWNSFLHSIRLLQVRMQWNSIESVVQGVIIAMEMWEWLYLRSWWSRPWALLTLTGERGTREGKLVRWGAGSKPGVVQVVIITAVAADGCPNRGLIWGG